MAQNNESNYNVELVFSEDKIINDILVDVLVSENCTYDLFDLES